MALIDWESWWNIEYSIGPSIAIKYLDQLYNWYAPFFNKNIPVDILSLDKDFNNYKIIIAPLLNMISLEHAEKIKKFTENGGIFITTYFSGIVNKDDQVYLGGYPGAFRDLLGLWVEEVDALSPEINNQIILNKDLKLREKQYKCNLIFEIIHTTHAKSLATYGKEYYKDSTCITRNKYGKGEAWYIGTQPESIFLNDFIGYLKEEFFLKSNFSNKSNIEITCREDEKNFIYFIMNHGDKIEKISLDNKEYFSLLNNIKIRKKVILQSRDVEILSLKKR